MIYSKLLVRSSRRFGNCSLGTITTRTINVTNATVFRNHSNAWLFPKRILSQQKSFVTAGERVSDSTKKKIFFMVFGGTGIGLAAFLYVMNKINFKSSKEGNRSAQSNPVAPVKFPSDSKTIPRKVPYLLIGGGTASFSAFRAIKSNDPRAKVLMVSNELYYPYMRPPLTKEMWFEDKEVLSTLTFTQWSGTTRSLLFEPDEYFLPVEKFDNEPKGGLSIIRGWSVVKLDPSRNIATLNDGTEIEYEKCLIATGTRSRMLPVFKKPELRRFVSVFDGIDDFKKLYERISVGLIKSVIIIDSGFSGSELACVLSRNGKSGLDVTQVFAENGNMASILPEYLSNWVTDKIREQKINVINNVTVTDATRSDDKTKIKVSLSNGKELEADFVVVSCDNVANTEIANASDLEVDQNLGGYVVNAELVARTNLYAAGSCASFYDTQFGRRRIGHHDHAVITGRLAGENMVGAAKPYDFQSMFWSDLGPNIGYEGIGVVDSSLPTVGVFAKSSEKPLSETEKAEKTKEENDSKVTPDKNADYSKGVIFYLKDGYVVGIVLWNLFTKMSVARQVLNERRKFDDLNEVAKLFQIHESE